MPTFVDPGITPEEAETLQMSPVCRECGHRYAFVGEESGFCYVNGCCCSWFEEED
jgi:hypothetical protein